MGWIICNKDSVLTEKFFDSKGAPEPKLFPSRNLARVVLKAIQGRKDLEKDMHVEEAGVL